MRVGATISGAGHLGLLALAVFGLEPPRQDEAPVLAARDVSIVSLSAFNAAISAAPDVPLEETSALDAPQVVPQEFTGPEAEEAAQAVPDAEIPDAPDPDPAPDLSTFALADPDLITETPQPEAGPVGEDLPVLAGPSFDGSLNSDQTAMLSPSPAALAPRIDSRAAPKPPERSEAAPLPREATAPAPDAEPIDAVEEAAPEAATTEIVPDASEEPAHTPTAAMRPPGRPRAIVREKAEAEQAEAEAQARRAEEEAAIAAALAETENEAAASSAGERLGGDFTAGQKGAIGAFIDPYWNKSILAGKANYEDLVVVVRVRLAADGRLLGAVEPVAPASPTGDFSVAFQAARRAVSQAANAGLPLPQDKFRDGDFLEIRCDPGRGAVSFD